MALPPMPRAGGESSDSAALTDAASVLAAIDELWRREHDVISVGPLPGSLAAADSDLPLGAIASELGSMAWSIGADHALAWHRLLHVARAQPMAAHATLARSVIEGAVVCRWLLEPGIDARERRVRATAMLAEDYRQRRNFERSANIENVPRGRLGRTGAQRHAELERDIRRHGLVAAGKNVRRPPEVTQLFADFAIPTRRGDGEWLYRALSGYAHGKQWAALLGEMGEPRPYGSGGPGQIARFSSNDNLTLAIARFAMTALAVGLSELALYYGHESRSDVD